MKKHKYKSDFPEIGLIFYFRKLITIFGKKNSGVFLNIIRIFAGNHLKQSAWEK